MLFFPRIFCFFLENQQTSLLIRSCVSSTHLQVVLEDDIALTAALSPIDPAIAATSSSFLTSAAAAAAAAETPARRTATFVPRTPSPVFGTWQWAAASSLTKATAAKLAFGFEPITADDRASGAETVLPASDAAAVGHDVPEMRQAAGEMSRHDSVCSCHSCDLAVEEGAGRGHEGGSGHWGAEGTGGGMEEESPSRVRERALRRKLMRLARAGRSGALSNYPACFFVFFFPIRPFFSLIFSLPQLKKKPKVKSKPCIEQ